MKKLLALAIIPLMLLSACGNSAATTSETTAETTVTEATAAETTAPADITAAVIAEVPITSGVAKTLADVPDYYGVDSSTLADASFYICGSGAYPDELAVFLFNDADSAKAGETALKDRLAEQTELYSTYTPDEMYKLEGAKVYTSGNYAVFIAMADNDKADSIVKGLIG